ncbi:hypothetical protein EPD60_13670 [Flaviaesturariibacter flavus]|uniref:Uncharacterized protein n=1 Tax=Flaviaesturariibacter flavus TaxID=2502780 RepID=A0A4R1B941_9BACT|nr:hypothetical protein [Flaviaesturariibacter flavus]TCJ13113.1 hypothetical protein EPD60_13670 [Flaviaesturariibacter flavus]
MRILLLLLSLFTATVLFAQKRGAASGEEASWKITYGKKTLLSTSVEDEAVNVITLRRADLKKNGTFTLQFKPAAGQATGWKRTIGIYGPSDETLKEFSGNKLSLSSLALSGLLRGRTQVKIWTMAIPSDPKKAALVRMRRVHLVTINVE